MRLIKFLLRSFFTLAFALVFVVFLGLPLFYFNIASEPTENKDKTDAIIVVTGSGERIPEAIRALNEGLAPKLLISGVGKDTKALEILDTIAIGWRDLVKTDMSRINLGYAATDTVGNASESEEWVKENNIKSVRLVTSNYHMPRTRMEFRKLMPDLEIIEHPVIPHSFDKHKWQESKPVRDLIVKEYFKYLYSWLGFNKEDMGFRNSYKKGY